MKFFLLLSLLFLFPEKGLTFLILVLSRALSLVLVLRRLWLALYYWPDFFSQSTTFPFHDFDPLSDTFDVLDFASTVVMDLTFFSVEHHLIDLIFRQGSVVILIKTVKLLRDERVFFPLSFSLSLTFWLDSLFSKLRTLSSITYPLQFWLFHQGSDVYQFCLSFICLSRQRFSCASCSLSSSRTLLSLTMLLSRRSMLCAPLNRTILVQSRDHQCRNFEMHVDSTSFFIWLSVIDASTVNDVSLNRQ